MTYESAYYQNGEYLFYACSLASVGDAIGQDGVGGIKASAERLTNICMSEHIKKSGRGLHLRKPGERRPGMHL